MDFKAKLIALLEKETKLKDVSKILSVPPDPKLGDYAFPCFALGKNPKEAAEKLKKKIKKPVFISKMEVVGPYLNFFLDKTVLAKETLKQIFKEKEKYGGGKDKKEKILVEYVGPNTNKSLHLGHVRNAALGIAISNIIEFAGYRVIRVNINNDRGMGLCEAMLGYEMFHKNEKPDRKSDHFVAQCYVDFKQAVKKDPELQDKARELLVKWEAGDKDARALWKKITTWVLKGYKETYKKLGVTFDKEYYESKLYKEGQDIVQNGLKKGLFKKKDGAVIAKLEEYKMPDKILLKSDGTAVYMTQDLYLGKIRHDEFKFDRSIYVVGSDHELHFRQLFKIFEILGRKWATKCYHLAYGMIHLPEGRMKSREGTVVDADNLIAEVESLAQKEIKKRHKELSQTELEARSEIIALGAIKFLMLKTDSTRNIIFNPKESISFEGETGPYIQYAHARCASILRKADQKIGTKVHFESLSTAHEKKVIVHLANFGSVIETAANGYKPYMIAKYVLDLAQYFNEFYHNCPVISDLTEVMHARLLLVSCVKQVLKNGLGLLGISAPEEM